MKKYGYIKTNTTAARQYQSRAAVWIVVGLALLFLMFRWGATSTPHQVGSVGERATLSEDTYAIASMYKYPKNSEAISAGLATLGISGAPDYVVFLKNGGTLAVTEDNVSQYGTNLSRPHGWFRLNTLGVVHASNDTIRLARSGNGLKVALPSKADIIEAHIPLGVSAAFHVSQADFANTGLDESVSSLIPDILDTFDVFHTGEETILVFPSDIDPVHIKAFATESAKRLNPSTSSRQLPDRTTYKELVPAENVQEGTISHHGVEVTHIGDTAFAWYIESDDERTIMSSSLEGLKDYSERLSTQLLTNSFCGERVESVLTLNSSQTTANNEEALFYLVRTLNSWKICQSTP